MEGLTDFRFICKQSSFLALFPLMVGLYVDRTFSDSAKEVIKSAVGLFVKNALDSDVLDCAFSKSKIDLPISRAEFEGDYLFALIPKVLKNESDDNLSATPLVVGKVSNEEGIVGVSYNNYYGREDVPKVNGKGMFYVALNSDYLGSEPSFSFSKNAAYWAGVIAHGILHNFGYDHPTRHEGSFVSEYGKRIQQVIEESSVNDSIPENDAHFEDRVIDLPK